MFTRRCPDSLVVTLECHYKIVVLFLEFESRRVEILDIFAKIKKDQLPRVPSVGRLNSTRVDEGRKSWKSSRDKNAKARTVVGRGGEKSLRCDPGSEVRLGEIEQQG